jgi:hypothetical protein
VAAFVTTHINHSRSHVYFIHPFFMQKIQSALISFRSSIPIIMPEKSKVKFTHMNMGGIPSDLRSTKEKVMQTLARSLCFTTNKKGLLVPCRQAVVQNSTMNGKQIDQLPPVISSLTLGHQVDRSSTRSRC